MATPLRIALTEGDRKQRWLADTTGIAYDRIHRIVGGGLEATITEAYAIARALERPITELFPNKVKEVAS